MSIIGTLVVNIIPLYIIIALGYMAGRRLDVDLQSLARIAIFIISPIVIFGAMVKLVFDPSYILLPVVFFAVSCSITYCIYTLAKKRWKSNTANLIGLGCVSGNGGYFGFPLVLALYGDVWGGVYLFMNLSMTIAENTVGFYIAARGHHTIRESLMKVLKLPGVHAIYLGLLTNFSGAHLPDVFFRYWNYAVGTWVFIGMMLMGVALGKCRKLEFNARLLGWLFAAKFILWPLAGIAVIAVDKFVLHLLPPEVHGMILLFSSIPLMANLVPYAAQLNLHPEKAATAVLLSTVFAVFYMPALFLLAGHAGLILLHP